MVTIKGDLIEGNTIVADKLVMKGDDGLFYKLNISAANGVWGSMKVKMNSDYALSLDDIHDYEKIYGKIPKGAFVAMRSDWGKRWPSQEKFQNMDEYGEQHYPGWSLEAVKYLIEKRDVTAIGHETFDTDPPFCKEQRYFQAECYVLKQDRYQIEMLTNLDKIPERGAIIFCIFVKQTNGTGFPVRCFAICPNK